MNLNFEVTNQLLHRTEAAKLVEQSRNYVRCKFDFKSGDWQGLTKAALFQTTGMEKPVACLIADDECIFPAAAARGKCTVAVIGASDAGVINGNVDDEAVVITTNIINIIFDDTLNTDTLADLEEPENDFTLFLASLETTIKAYAAAEMEEVKNTQGKLSDLKTTDKTSLVAAINELLDTKASPGDIEILDGKVEAVAGRVETLETSFGECDALAAAILNGEVD